MAANEQRSLPLSCRTHPLCLALRRPRVADGFGGQDQAPPDCGSVTPERVEPVLGTPSQFWGHHTHLCVSSGDSMPISVAAQVRVLRMAPPDATRSYSKAPGKTPCRLRLGSATPLHVRSTFPSCS